MERSPELSKIISGWFEAVAKGDASWIDRHVSRQAEVRLVGTDPAEWLAGSAAAEFLTEEAKAMGGKVTIDAGQPEAYREGTVGWGIARPTITLPNGIAITPRWGAVFHQEGDQWKIVQIHASIGVPNEQVMGG